MRKSEAPIWQADVRQASGLLIHALYMLNELPTEERRGSAALHAIAAVVVLCHSSRVAAQAVRLAHAAKEAA